jgi:diguanylate cyclase (GGDEF)-like protein/PAS domain S-box-containing protein
VHTLAPTPPANLLARLRWLFLLIALGDAALVVSFVLAAPGGGPVMALVVLSLPLATVPVVVLGRLAGRDRRAAAAERERERGEARMGALLEHAADGVVVLARDGAVTWASPAVGRVLGVDPAALVGRPAHELVHPDDRGAAREAAAGARSAPGASASVRLRARHADGRVRWLACTLTDRLEDPAVEGVVVNVQDVTERQALEAELAHRALHDPLTGLPTRALLLERLEHALQRSRRTGCWVAVLLCDVDGLERVNHELGHAAGDELLREVARRLDGLVRAADTVARLGGDELVVLADQLTGVDEAAEIAARIDAAMSAPVRLGERGQAVQLSVGVALTGPGTAADATTLLREAAGAVARAKRRARGER